MIALVSVSAYVWRTLCRATGLQDDEEEEKAYGQGLVAGEHHIGWLKAVFYVSMVWLSPRLDDRPGACDL